jgi:hypothetical protein
MGPALLGGSSSKLSKHSFERRRRETPSRECVCARDSSWHIARTSCFFQTRATFYILRAQFGKTNARRRVWLAGGERELPKSAVKKPRALCLSVCVWEEPLGLLCVSLSFVNMFLLLLLLSFFRPVILFWSFVSSIAGMMTPTTAAAKIRRESHAWPTHLSLLAAGEEVRFSSFFLCNASGMG